MLPRGIVSIDSSGEITDVYSSDNVDSLAGVEHYSGILLPGMVNAHSHLELSYLKDKIEPQCGFAGFASSLSQLRGEFTLEQRLRAVDYWDAQMWQSGVQAVGDVCNGNSTLQIKSRSKIEYLDFLELFGLSAESANSLDDLYSEHRVYDIRCNYSPHSTYSLAKGAFSDVVSRSSAQLPISVHFMETPGELDLFTGRGELSAWYKTRDFKVDFCDEHSPASRIINNISGDRKVLLVHNTCLRREDALRLVDHFGDNLTWVLCPRSNKFISGLEPDLELLCSVGGRIALGTDSLASNADLSMADEMLCFGGKVELETLLKWATVNGAEALGLAGRLGSIKKGSKCGLVLLEGCDLNLKTLTSESRTKRLL